jgi:glucosylceramidase
MSTRHRPSYVTRRRSVGPVRLARLLLAGLLAATGLTGAVASTAQAAGEQVTAWLTTTDDSAGRHVVRGLEQQAPFSFQAGTTGSGGDTIAVDENTRYQTFTGGGASFTDTAAWLLNSSGALSQATRDDTMKTLFSPTDGIGLSFLRNPMGASDLARTGYTYDDVPAGQSDPDLASFSISHDLADVVPLTRQALQLDPDLTVMATPWTAPAWMKDSDSLNGGWLKAEDYGTYAQYFVKYLEAYRDQGVPVSYVTAQNEPTCCDGYPSMSWNASGLDYFTANDLLPALQSAGLSTKVLAHDWNWDSYDAYAAQTVDDTAVRNSPNFGGIAWHGYEGDVTEQTTVHNENQLDAFDTEHSGGTWIADQQQEDMNNIIDYTRNWGKSVTKWSLAVDQNMGPHNGGCGTCTGLVTVHDGDDRSGQVDYTVEYYDMGQLTKFVRPGAQRIASSPSSSVPNVAWRNPDGSKALIAYNGDTSAKTVTIDWGTEHATYTLPARTSATFTWSGTQSGTSDQTGHFTGLAGKCLDVAGGGTANGTAVDLYDCNGTSAQQWTVRADGSLQALGKCLDVTSGSTDDGAKVQLYDCNGTSAQQWSYNAATGDIVDVAADKCLDVTDQSSANGALAQIWTCGGTSNQKWYLQQ